MNRQSLVVSIALLALSGCTSATVSLPDGTTASFTRWWTDAAIRIDESGFIYSSNASDVAQQALIDKLLLAIGVASGKPIMLRMPENGL